MKKSVISFSILIFVSILSAQVKEVKFDAYFDSLDAAFIIYDYKNETLMQYNLERCNKGFIPASTFKIPNTLIALETGVVKDEHQIMRWDGKQYSIKEWNRDHDLRSAFKYSVVPYYQEIARNVGDKRMLEFVQKFDYGNKNIEGGIDRFWLNGKIRITPMQQLEFLKRIYEEDLPVSKRSLSILKDIMIADSTENYILRAKTGTGNRDNGGYVVWYVGYLERKDNTFFFILNFDAGESNAKLQFRKDLTYKILRDMKIIE